MVKTSEIAISIYESELCRKFGLSKVKTAKWIGTKGNRKIVIYGVKK